jgi:potassium/chloride transporter 9
MVLYSSIILIFCTIICLIGSRIFAKASLLLAFILSLSTISVIASLALRSPFENVELGVYFTGLKWSTFVENLWPSFSDASGVYAGALFSFSLIFPGNSI